MTVTRGREHVFLGMNIKFNDEEGTATIGMKEHVQEAVDDFPEVLKRKVSTPAKKDLFTIDPESPPLDESRGKIFHSLTMKLMYVCQRSRPDIMTTIAFLCTRVSKSTVQDWEKLKRLMGYLRHTIDEELTLGADRLDSIGSFVYVSFAVHEDMRSHTGGGISFGRGIILGRSTKQKINTTSRSWSVPQTTYQTLCG